MMPDGPGQRDPGARPRGDRRRAGGPRILAAVVVPPHLSVSGGARAAEQLSAALARYCDVSVASMMNGAGVGLSHEQVAAVRRLPVASRLPPLLPWRWLPNRYSTLFYRSDLPRLVQGGGYDLVHLHNPMPALELARTARACQAAGVPYVISTHGFNEVANGIRIYGFDRLRSLVWQRLVVTPVSRAVRGASAVFALSPADFDIVRGMGYAGEIAVVTNGVPRPGPADPEADATVLGRFGLRDEGERRSVRCMFLANHTPNKGLPHLLAAFSWLEVPFTLAIGGEKRDGVDYEGPARACGPGQRIAVTGRLSDIEVAALFRWADLFVFPTLADTFPLVVLEAMSHGVPVLASRIGGIPHQIDDTCGVLVDAGDVEGLAAAVTELATDPARLADMGRAAAARVAASFTWDHAAQQALAAYGRILGRDARRADPAGAGAELASVE